jgi:hypothetical protein
VPVQDTGARFNVPGGSSKPGDADLVATVVSGGDQLVDQAGEPVRLADFYHLVIARLMTDSRLLV